MRRVISFLALIALSWCAFAGDLDSSKATLGSALTTRIAAIGVPPNGSVAGVVNSTSNEHGTVFIPVDMFLDPP